MSQLIESIRIENRKFHHLKYHNQRFNSAAKKLYGIKENINLENYISIPSNISDNRYKCRVAFNGEDFNINITPYTQRNIHSIKLVRNDFIDYSIKTDNRSELNEAYEQRGNCDDIIIVKNDELTDSWAANVILFDGSQWYTPLRPLLPGTQRAVLIDSGIIKPMKIRVSDLSNFKFIKLINALIDFNRANLIDVKNIHPL